MRILIYGINYAPELTGIGKYTAELVEWLAGRGHEIRVVTAPPYYPSWKIGEGYSSFKYKIEKSGTSTVFRCPLWVPHQPSGFKRIIHLLSFAISSFPVIFSNIFWRPDVILTIEPPLFTAPAALLVSLLCKAKAWLHIQDFEIDAAFDLGIIPAGLRKGVVFFEKLLMGRFSRVSTISEKMLERLERKGVPLKKAVLFPNWVDTQVIFPADGPNPMRRELGISDEAYVALYSGNMGEKQGLEIIIDAASRLENMENLTFVLCGTGSAYSRLKDKAADLTNIFWVPLQPMEKLNSLLNLADIHLLPQRADATDLVMPSKLTGMMASGRPVLATAFEGTQIARSLESSGKTVAPGDAAAFASALEELAHDSGLRQRLGDEARRYAVEHWDKENVLKRFEKSLKDLLHRVD